MEQNNKFRLKMKMINQRRHETLNMTGLTRFKLRNELAKIVSCLTIFLCVLVCAPVAAQTKSTSEHSKNSIMQLVETSANTLGGADKIRALHNLTLQGYAQYAYMWGGGNITASPNAPQKWMAANDLQRIWDFDNDIFQLKERRNMLFPFAALFGHAFFPVNQVLDHNISYDKLGDGKFARIGEFEQNPLFIDGTRVRKLWSLTNPVSLLHAILTNKVTVTDLHKKNNLLLLTIQADKDVTLVLALDGTTKIPVSVQWSTPQNNLGEVRFTSTFTGYMPFDGIMLPMGYNTKMDFRDIVYFKMYVDGYRINTAVENLKTPESIRNAEVPVEKAPVIEVENVGKGVWRLTGGTTVVEFKDHLLLFELYGSQILAKAIIEKANTLVPNKKATELIVSHHHFDHTAGFRAGVAAGLKVYSSRANEGILREMAERPTPHFADVLRGNNKFKFVPVDKHLALSDGSTTLDIYHVISNNHMADAVFAYIPAQHLMIEGDIGTAASDWQLWPESYTDNLKFYGITVDKISPVHEKVMTHSELLQFIEAGRQRAIKRGMDYQKMNEYLPGYPIFEPNK